LAHAPSLRAARWDADTDADADADAAAAKALVLKQHPGGLVHAVDLHRLLAALMRQRQQDPGCSAGPIGPEAIVSIRLLTLLLRKFGQAHHRNVGHLLQVG